MTKVILTERFKKDLYQITSSRLFDRIETNVKNLRVIPDVGSRDLPKSIIEEFGTSSRKLAIPPFLLIYKYLELEEKVYVYALLHERRAR